MLDIAYKLITAHPFLGATPEALAEVIATCSERRFKPGQVLCKEKTYGDEVFIVMEGRVVVSRLDAVGRSQNLTALDAPTMLGQLSLIDNAIRSATVSAEGYVTARVLDRQTWLRLSHAPTAAGAALRRIFLSSLHQQLFRTHDRIAKIASGQDAHRVAPSGKVIPVVSMSADDFAPDELTDDLTDEEKIEVLNPYK